MPDRDKIFIMRIAERAATENNEYRIMLTSKILCLKVYIN